MVFHSGVIKRSLRLHQVKHHTLGATVNWHYEVRLLRKCLYGFHSIVCCWYWQCRRAFLRFYFHCFTNFQAGFILTSWPHSSSGCSINSTSIIIELKFTPVTMVMKMTWDNLVDCWPYQPLGCFSNPHIYHLDFSCICSQCSQLVSSLLSCLLDWQWFSKKR